MSFSEIFIIPADNIFGPTILAEAHHNEETKEIHHESNTTEEQMEVKEGIVIDVKGNLFKKPLSDIQILIYKELYGKEWHMHVTDELEQNLDNLQITKSKNDQEGYEKEEEKRDARSTLLSAKESLKRKLKGQRVSYHERIYLYKQMKTSEKPLAEIALENNLSLGTLYNIRKEFDTPIKGPELVKSTTARNLVESPKIKNIIKAYLDSTKTPWSSKDVWSYIKDKTGLVIHSRVVRRILTEELKMSYKKGKDRLVNFDEKLNSKNKQWFSIRLCKTIDSFKILINVDETSFSRMTKKNLTWIPKGKEQIVKNICFRNSWSLVTAITSTGSVFAAKRVGTITSIMILDYLRELVRFIKESEKVETRHYLIILDNASVHRAEIVREYMKSEHMSIAFIPQYSPELAPIEHYFSKLKQEVIDRARGKDIDWKTSGSSELLKRSMQAIPSSMVRRIWKSFTKEIYKCLDSF